MKSHTEKRRVRSFLKHSTVARDSLGSLSLTELTDQTEAFQRTGRTHKRLQAGIMSFIYNKSQGATTF
jgi:hypothetical protein